MMIPTIAENVKLKRRHSVSYAVPAKRVKRSKSLDLTSERIPVKVDEIHQIANQYKKQCIIKKRTIDNITNELLLLSVRIEERITEFKTSFDASEATNVLVTSGNKFLQYLLNDIGINLEVWNRRLENNKDEGLLLPPKQETETNTPKDIVEGDEGDIGSVHSFSSDKTVVNVIANNSPLVDDIRQKDFDRLRDFDFNGALIEPSATCTNIEDVCSDTDSYIFDLRAVSTTICIDDDTLIENSISIDCDNTNPKDSLMVIDVEASSNSELYNVASSNFRNNLEKVIESATENNDPTTTLKQIGDIIESGEFSTPQIVSKEDDYSAFLKLNTEVFDIDKLEVTDNITNVGFNNDEDYYSTQNGVLDTTSNIHGLVQNVDVIPNEDDVKEKIDFLNCFGLKSNLFDADIEDKQESDEIKAALDRLRSSKDEMMNFLYTYSSDENSRLTDDEYTSLVGSGIDEEISNTEKRISVEEVSKSGKITNCLPDLPRSSGTDESCTPLGNVPIQLKDCTVPLNRLNENYFIKETSDTHKSDHEHNVIERLMNLNTLNVRTGRRKMGSSTFNRNACKKLATNRTKTSSGTDDYTDDDIAPVKVPTTSDIEKTNYYIPFDLYDIEEQKDDGSTDNIKKNNNKFTESDKENKNRSKTKRALTVQEKLKSNWRYDKLLRTNILLSDSDGEIEEKRSRQTTSSNSSELVEMEIGREKTSNENHILIHSDSYDSEIEFVSERKQNKSSRHGLQKNKCYLEESSSDSDNDKGDTSDEESTVIKKGRKNIREIIGDEILEEATKNASLNEKKRKERLTQKQRSINSFVTQQLISTEKTGLVLDVNEENHKVIVAVHPILTKRLKPHQIKGVRFMWESCYEGVKQLATHEGTGCILAHCMGLGKTFQVIALIHTLFSHSVTNTKHVLIVCPLSIVRNWNVEFETGLEHLHNNPKINIILISDNARTFEQRLACIHKWRKKGGVLIMGYESFQSLVKFKDLEKLTSEELKLQTALINPGPDLVVLDEGHLLKNGTIDRTKSLMRIQTKRRIVLSGTPLQNNLKEYYHMVQFVKPNFLGTYHEFSNRFINPITNGQFDDSTLTDYRKMQMRTHVLHKMLKDTIQRFEADELKNYLPPRYDYVLFIELHSVQRELYNKYIQLVDTKHIKKTILVDYHQLQLISSHPYLLYLKEQKKILVKKKPKEMDVIELGVDPDVLDFEGDKTKFDNWWKSLYPEGCSNDIEYGTKFSIMLSIIRECEKIGDKVLIFTNSLIELDAIEHFLHLNETEESKWKLQEDYFRMDGSVSPEERLKLCNLFNNKKNKVSRVFLISYKVGGLGLNLVGANRVILMDVSWNPAVDNQSLFRAYRFGQDKQCYVYRFVTYGTMEQVVYERQVTKSAIARRVVDEKQISRPYKKNELEEMYRSRFDLYQQKMPHILPEDSVLKHILVHHDKIAKYHEHNTLFVDRPDEKLDEVQRRLAWEDYNKEQAAGHNNILEQHRKRVIATAMASAAATNAVAAANAIKSINATIVKNPNVSTKCLGSATSPTNSKNVDHTNTTNICNIGNSSTTTVTTNGGVIVSTTNAASSTSIKPTPTFKFIPRSLNQLLPSSSLNSNRASIQYSSMPTTGSTDVTYSSGLQSRLQTSESTTRNPPRVLDINQIANKKVMATMNSTLKFKTLLPNPIQNNISISGKAINIDEEVSKNLKSQNSNFNENPLLINKVSKLNQSSKLLPIRLSTPITSNLPLNYNTNIENSSFKNTTIFSPVGAVIPNLNQSLKNVNINNITAYRPSSANPNIFMNIINAETLINKTHEKNAIGSREMNLSSLHRKQEILDELQNNCSITLVPIISNSNPAINTSRGPETSRDAPSTLTHPKTYSDEVIEIN